MWDLVPLDDKITVKYSTNSLFLRLDLRSMDKQKHLPNFLNEIPSRLNSYHSIISLLDNDAPPIFLRDALLAIFSCVKS